MNDGNYEDMEQYLERERERRSGTTYNYGASREERRSGTTYNYGASREEAQIWQSAADKIKEGARNETEMLRGLCLTAEHQMALMRGQLTESRDKVDELTGQVTLLKEALRWMAQWSAAASSRRAALLEVPGHLRSVIQESLKE